jgi:hypothetical protein
MQKGETYSIGCLFVPRHFGDGFSSSTPTDRCLWRCSEDAGEPRLLQRSAATRSRRHIMM